MLKSLIVAAAFCGAVASDALLERARMVDFINSANVTWTASLDTRFGKSPIGVSKPLLGVKADNHIHLKSAIANGEVDVISTVAASIPESFDSGSNPDWDMCANIINTIRDQSNCGCCWAFGAASAASDRMCIATKGAKAFPLSAEDLCFCGSFNGCGGGYLVSAWSHIKSDGLVTGAGQGGGFYDDKGFCKRFSLPHCHHHGPQGSDPYPAEGEPGCPSESSPRCPRECDDDAVAPHNDFSSDKFKFTGRVATFDSVEAIQTAIMTDGPVEAAFTVYGDFENYAGGVYSHVKGEILGGHAIRIVGWGVDGEVKYWKVANSWNPYWGENGYFRIRRGSDECGIESQATANGDGSWVGGDF